MAKKPIRASALKIEISWIFNKRIMNFRVFFPCLRGSSYCCHDYLSLQSLVHLWLVQNVDMCNCLTVGMYRLSYFTAFEHTIPMNHASKRQTSKQKISRFFHDESRTYLPF